MRGDRYTEREREITFNTQRYLDARMQDAAVLLWAARLGPHREVERRAVRNVLAYPRNPIAEPYQTAWRHVVESWTYDEEDPDLKAAGVAHTLGQGVSPGLMLSAVVDLVTPRLEIETSSLWEARRKRRPVTADDLVYATLVTRALVRLDDVGLGEVDDPAILRELIDRLDAALVQSLHRADRLGATAVWIVNHVAQVYAPLAGDQDAGDDDDQDSDAYRRGFAPVVRLYSEVMERLAGVDPAGAAVRMARLRLMEWPLAKRLWASAARDRRVADSQTVGDWLVDLDDETFWSLARYPEIAELRARRFADLDEAQQAAVKTRLGRRPPAKIFNAKLDRDRREALRDAAVARELARIEQAAAPEGDDLGSVVSDLYETSRYMPPDTPSVYTPEGGESLVSRLEADLKGRLYVEGRSAMDFVSTNADRVFEAVQKLPKTDAYPRVWAAIASSDRERWIGVDPKSPLAAQNLARARILLAALNDQSAASLRPAIDGISYWMDGVAHHLGGDDAFRSLWLKLWPAAVAATNAESEPDDADQLRLVERNDDDLASAALNSSTGRMMSAFLATLPQLSDDARPFEDSRLAAMRAAVLDATGLALRQAMFRLLQALAYFRRADPEWANANLVGPLTAGDHDPRLWEAISRIGLLPLDALAIIGPAMARAAYDLRLSETVRARLTERLLLPMLSALDADKPLPVGVEAIEQMLRLGGDAVRGAGGRSLVRFMESPSEDKPARYARSVQRVLREAWPRDQSARSARLSDALASLPAAAEAAFATVVTDIKPFLTPFQAWSLWEYRLYGKEAGDRRVLLFPNDAAEADALLQLLDLTIGQEEGATAPRDLDVALDAIAGRDAALEQDRRFRRLLALARR